MMEERKISSTDEPNVPICMLITYESVILQPNGRLMNDNKQIWCSDGFGADWVFARDGGVDG